MLKNKMNLKVKCLLSNNGGEYEDDDIKKYQIENKLNMVKTIPGKHQQNSVAERMSKSLNERAKSMRFCMLTKTLSADIVNTKNI